MLLYDSLGRLLHKVELLHARISHFVDFSKSNASPQSDFRARSIDTDTKSAELDRYVTQNGVLHFDFFFQDVEIASVYLLHSLRSDVILLGPLQKGTPEKAVYLLSLSPTLFGFIYFVNAMAASIAPK